MTEKDYNYYVDGENDDEYFANNDINKEDYKPKITKVDYDNEKVYFEVAGVEFEKRLWYHHKVGYYFEISKFRYNLDGEITKQYGKVDFQGDEPVILDEDYKRVANILNVKNEKNKARVIKAGFQNGKQKYALKYEQKVIKQSIYKDKLLKEADEINKGDN